jgi:hypothetical protein
MGIYLAELPVENVEIFFIGDGDKHVVIVVIIRKRNPFRKTVSWNSDCQAEQRD